MPLFGRRVTRPLVFALTLALLGASLAGCATRTVRHPIVRRNLIEVDLVREVRGFSVQERGYEHPAIISAQRLSNILGAIEIEAKADGAAVVRQPAFHPDIIPRTAEHLSAAFERAGPDEAVGVIAIHKSARLGILHRKFLTTFLAYMKDDQLYILLRRVDWPLKQGEENDRLPVPMRERKAQDFRVVTGEPIYFAGVQDLEIDWRNDAFAQAFRLPGTTKGRKRRREVLETTPVPKAELDAAAPEGVGIDSLTPEQLRALADLEEDRRAGRITETAYQRARRQLLRKR